MIRIGARQFRKKVEAGRHILSIRDSRREKQPLTGEDDLFMRALIDMHPNRIRIIDCGIDYIYWEYRDGGWGFSVYRTDKSSFDFAWKYAISPRNPFTEVCSTLRNAVWNQIEDYASAHFRRCENPDCRVQIPNRSGCEVDHIAPLTFENLVKAWQRSVRLNEYDIEIIKSSKYGGRSRLANPFLEQSWREYHEINARLRCLCPPCHKLVTRKRPISHAAD
jgi:hypothetical protein